MNDGAAWVWGVRDVVASAGNLDAVWIDGRYGAGGQKPNVCIMREQGQSVRRFQRYNARDKQVALPGGIQHGQQPVQGHQASTPSADLLHIPSIVVTGREVR